VQSRIGGGSYTTVKRYLDTWRRHQAEQTSAVEPPPDLVEKGNELTRALWRSAQQWAEREVKLVREQAAADVQAAKREQVAALEEVRMRALTKSRPPHQVSLGS